MPRRDSAAMLVDSLTDDKAVLQKECVELRAENKMLIAENSTLEAKVFISVRLGLAYAVGTLIFAILSIAGHPADKYSWLWSVYFFALGIAICLQLYGLFFCKWDGKKLPTSTYQSEKNRNSDGDYRSPARKQSEVIST
jgi:hypothetical protein